MDYRKARDLVNGIVFTIRRGGKAVVRIGRTRTMRIINRFYPEYDGYKDQR